MPSAKVIGCSTMQVICEGKLYPLAYSKIEDFIEEVNESGLKLKMLGGAAYLEDEKGNSSRDFAYVLEGTQTSGADVVMALVSAEKLYSYSEYVCGVEVVGKMCQITSHDCFIDEIDVAENWDLKQETGGKRQW